MASIDDEGVKELQADGGAATLVVHTSPNETTTVVATVVRAQEGGGSAAINETIDPPNPHQDDQPTQETTIREATPTEQTPLVQSPQQPRRHGIQDRQRRVAIQNRQVQEAEQVHVMSCCDKLCHPFCLPCSDKAVAALLQMLSLLFILILLGLTLYGPVLCDNNDMRSTGTISLVAPVMMLLVVMTCFMTQCACANGRGNKQTRMLLYVFGFVFCLAFVLAVAAESYFVYRDRVFIENSLKVVKRKNIHCQLSIIAAVNLFFNYTVIFIASIAWVVSIFYIIFSSTNSKRRNIANGRRRN